MSDIVTLGIRIDASGVVTGVSIGEREFNKLANAADRTVKRVSAIDKGFGSLKNTLFSFVSTATVLKVFHDLIQDTTQAEQSQKRFEGVLRATGRTAGLTAKELEDLASELQATTLVDDEGVKNAEAVLLSFRRVQGDTFREAIKLAGDMSFVLGGDLSSAAMQLGKALNDPIQGISSLKRAGVQLTDEQERSVKQFIKVNDIAGAQKVIIGELTKQFGGTAAGAKAGLSGALHDASTAYHELLEEAGKGQGVLTSLFNSVAGGLNTLRAQIDQSPSGKQARLASEIEGLKQANERARGAGIAGPGPLVIEAREARIRELTAQYDAQAISLTRLSAAEEAVARMTAKYHAAQSAEEDRLAAAKEKRDEVRKKINEVTKALQDEAATLGMSAGQSRIYELRMLGASAATLKLAQANADLIDSFDRLQQQHEDRVERAIGQGNAVPGGSAAGPADAGIAPILQGARATGAREAANAARFDDLNKKNEEAAQFFEAIWKRAAENSQDALADFLTDIGSNLDSAEDLFKNFAKAITRMLAEIAAARILGGTGEGGGWFGDLLKGLSGGAAGGKGGAARGNATQSMHGGGRVGSDGLWRLVDPSVFASAERYHRGGMPGLRPGEIPIIAERGEGILSKGQMADLAAGGGGGSGPTVVHLNYTANVQALDSRGVAEVLEQHGSTVAGIALRAMGDSAAFRRGMRGRR